MLGGFEGRTMGVGPVISHSSGNTSTHGLLRIGGEFDFGKTMGVVAEWNDIMASGGSASSFLIGIDLFKAAGHSSAAKAAAARWRRALAPTSSISATT